MPVIINIIVCFLAILAFILCGYYSLFRKTLLSKELDSIANSYDSCDKDKLSHHFTLFLAQRKLNYWGTVLKDIVGPSMLISMLFSIVQWGDSLKTSGAAGWDEVKQFIENPGVVFYVNFVLISYVAMTAFIIDQTIRSFSSIREPVVRGQIA